MTQYEKEQDLFVTKAEETLRLICAHTANGGSVIDLCREWGVQFSSFCEWQRTDDKRHKAYADAVRARDEWAIESILNEIRDIGHADIRELYDQKGALLPISEWPRASAKAVVGIESKEILDSDGAFIGETKKIKTIDKLKALELLGKKLALFVERHQHSVDETLESIMMKTYKPDADTPSES